MILGDYVDITIDFLTHAPCISGRHVLQYSFTDLNHHRNQKEEKESRQESTAHLSSHLRLTNFRCIQTKNKTDEYRKEMKICMRLESVTFCFSSQISFFFPRVSVCFKCHLSYIIFELGFY